MLSVVYCLSHHILVWLVLDSILGTGSKQKRILTSRWLCRKIMRERGGGRRERQTNVLRDRHRATETERDIQKEKQTGEIREERQRDRQTDRQTETDIQRQKDRHIHIQIHEEIEFVYVCMCVCMCVLACVCVHMFVFMRTCVLDSELYRKYSLNIVDRSNVYGLLLIYRNGPQPFD